MPRTIFRCGSIRNQLYLKIRVCICLFTKNLSQIFVRRIRAFFIVTNTLWWRYRMYRRFSRTICMSFDRSSHKPVYCYFTACVQTESFTAAQMLYHCFQKRCWGSYIKKTCLLWVGSTGLGGWVCPSVLPMLLCLNMPGILFDADADLQVNICPQFIVTQLAQREPSGRIISVIVADRCARNSAPPPHPPLESLLRYYSLHYCAYCYK